MFVFSLKNYFPALEVLLVVIGVVNGLRDVVINPYSDIILVFDQSDIMLSDQIRGRGRIYPAFKEWVTYYKEKEVDTRFSVIGCALEQPYIFFSENANVDRLHTQILGLQATKHGPIWRGNFDGCLRVIVDNIFKESKGDRPEAPNVMLFITNCYYELGDRNDDTSRRFEGAFGEVRHRIENTGGYLGIVCVLVPGNKPGYWFCFACDGPNFRSTVWKWAAKDWRNIINLTEPALLNDQLDQVLPKKEILQTQDCEEKDEWSECVQVGLQTGICHKWKPIIIIQPSDDSHARKCSPADVQSCTCPTPKMPPTTTKEPTTTTKEPSTTTKVPSTTTKEPSTTTKRPSTTTKRPSTTTKESPTTSTTTKTTSASKKKLSTTTTKKPTTKKRPVIVTKKSSNDSKMLPTDETEVTPFESTYDETRLPTKESGKRPTAKDNEGISLVMYIGIIVGGLLLLFVAVLVILLAVFCRRSQTKKRKPSRAEGYVSEQGRKDKRKGVHGGLNARTNSKTRKSENLTKHGGKTSKDRQRLKGVRANINDEHGSKAGKHEKKRKVSVPSHSRTTANPAHGSKIGKHENKRKLPIPSHSRTIASRVQSPSKQH